MSKQKVWSRFGSKKEPEEETFELCGEEVSVVDAMKALALAWDYKNDLIRDGQYYGS